uniref:Uncharacterized protein n=1 Tax=Fagus sylvatica TaxID=28930 RepID=A0A2N9I0S0_FAGSY
MAEAILYGVAQKMIENLGSQIFQEIGSLWGVEDELENIKNTVSRIQALLQDAVEQQNHNHQVKDWLEKLKDAVYDADDLLSEFWTEASRRKAVSGNKMAKKVSSFFAKSNSLAFCLEMSGKIEAMRKKLDAIAKEKNDFNLKVGPVEKHGESTKREETHSFVPNEKVIGREDDKKVIIKLLLDTNVEENVSIIPIVGIGGLGKTTLAQFVYNDEIVKTYFELKMWVCVSDVFDIKIIVQKLIYAIGEKPEDHSMDQLQDQLRKKIVGKKYLLVLDDVWSENPHKWDNLKNLLMGGAKGSKIVITTRLKLVADIISPVAIYTLNGLSEDQSWSLFKQIAFRKGEETNNHRLVEIGREIVCKCQGVPLAIKSIGSVLRFEKTERKWSYVKNNILESVTQQESGIFPILKLSYDYLPSYLKGCFAFCSLFPKDYEVDKVTLTQLWIAQGFIQSSNKDQQLEDVADEYFKNLLWRSFFEEVRDEFGGLKYKMHDLIHDLAQSIAGAECTLADLDGNNFDGKTRHVSFPFDIDSFFIETLSSLVKANNIRTFLLTSSEDRCGALKESSLNNLILSFRNLRALDLHGWGITRVPNSIGKLIHLKYLDLSFNQYIETLPNSVTMLWNLQTLKLSSCRYLKELPKDIRELISIKHLENSGCDSLSNMPRGLGQLTCLQTLPLFIVSKDSSSISMHNAGLSELNLLNSLRGTLKIEHLERLKDANSESKAANLREKQHLEKLILTWFVGYKDDEKSLEGLQPHQNLKSLYVWGYGGVRFSSWLSSLTNLVHLKLRRCNRCRYLPSLSQFPSLESLSLEKMNNLEYISDRDISEEVSASSTMSSTPFFPSLKSLTIQFCFNLKGWWRERNLVVTTSASTPDHHQQHQSLPSFPCLSSLVIYECPNLITMPLFPYLKVELFLKKVSLKPFQQKMEFPTSLPSSSFSPLSKLKSMTLGFIKDIESLPDEWALHLNSLKRLEIWGCPTLRSLSRAVQYLTSLEELEICDCVKFHPFSDMDDDGMEWQHLNCLRSLTFKELPKLKSLPAGLQNVTTLKELFILNCCNLISVPEWISNLTSLEQLEIVGHAPNLTSLPVGMSCLKSLRLLTIADCPNLITFPESISNLTSLENLQIHRCPNLTSLPNGMLCLRPCSPTSASSSRTLSLSQPDSLQSSIFNGY